MPETRSGIPDLAEVADTRERSAVRDPRVIPFPTRRKGAEDPIPEARRDSVVDPRIAEVVCEVVASEQAFAIAAGRAEVETPVHPFVARETGEHSDDEAARAKWARYECRCAEQE